MTILYTSNSTTNMDTDLQRLQQLNNELDTFQEQNKEELQLFQKFITEYNTILRTKKNEIIKLEKKIQKNKKKIQDEQLQNEKKQKENEKKALWDKLYPPSYKQIMDQLMCQLNVLHNIYIYDNVEIDNLFNIEGSITKKRYEELQNNLIQKYSSEIEATIPDGLREIALRVVPMCDHEFYPIKDYDSPSYISVNKLKLSPHAKAYFLFDTPVKKLNNSPYEPRHNRNAQQPGFIKQCLTMDDILQYKCSCIRVCKNCYAYSYNSCNKCEPPDLY